MAINISGLEFFMPIFSFLFVFIIVFIILGLTKVLGESKWLHVFIAFVMAIIFMSFSSSMELYLQTILPWFVVLIVVVFLVLLIAGFSTKALDKIMTPAFAWVIVAILVIIFLIAAVKVFNPVFHPELIVTSGDVGQEGIGSQIYGFFSSSRFAGSFLLIIVAGVVAWVLTKQ